MRNVFRPHEGWREGRAGPELLREDLRKLPGELVTKEIADGDKIHDLDDPHIVESIKQDWCEAQVGYTNPLLKEAEPLGAAAIKRTEHLTLNQSRVDEVRLRVMRAWAQTNIEWIEAGKTPDLRVRHVWFPKNDVNQYSLRRGNPPSDTDRPKHMRGLRLEIDLESRKLPETIVERLEAQRLRETLCGLH